MRSLVLFLLMLSLMTIIISLAIIVLSKDQDTLNGANPFPSASNPEPSAGWTSIFTNPFGINSSNGNSNNNNNNNNQPQDAFDAHVRQILIPRVSGTQGNIKVRDYIVNFLKNNQYHVELDEFTDSTPIGNVKFANIIASSNPKACRQLVLACHYDSKMMNNFLGAIDSAVPCAMLLQLSERFSKSFRPSADDTPEDTLGLRLIFFDGEEAFVEWSDTDSLYGARHLAQKWESQPAPTECANISNELQRIELFVLLDLIGTSDTTFAMYNMKLKHHYDALQAHERSYLSKNLRLTSAQLRKEAAFKTRFIPLDFIQDDHVPFKQRGVPILSLLAHPFPKVWHTVSDNYQAIDFPRTRRILHVLEQFVANYSSSKE